MINMSTSYCPYFVNTLAHIILLFPVRPENSRTKVMSSPRLSACKAMKKGFSMRWSLTAQLSAFELTGSSEPDATPSRPE